MSKIHYLVFLILILLVSLGAAFFTVDQRKSAVVFQFGEAMRTIDDPGLRVKIPFIQTVEFFDKRILHVDAEAKELTAADGKRIIIDAFAKFIITDPVMFFKTVHNDYGVQIRLNRILESSMRKVIGKVRLSDLLSKERTKIMLDTLEQVNEESKFFGIHVVDVRILRADLPKENSNAIYHRMQTEREKEAKQIRAEGKEEDARIRSRANKESQIIRANAYMQAQVIKGEGDATATKLYNIAYSQDPEFYKYYKSLLVYSKVFSNDDTSFIIPPDSDFLKYFGFTH